MRARGTHGGMGAGRSQRDWHVSSGCWVTPQNLYACLELDSMHAHPSHKHTHTHTHTHTHIRRQVLRDTREFRAWVAGSAARGVPEGWAEWNANQLSALRNDAGVQVPRYRFYSTLAIVLPRCAFALILLTLHTSPAPQ